MTVTFPAPSPPYLGPAKYQGEADNKPIDRIVMHGTVSPTVEGGARAIARYFVETVTRPSSGHYVVDPAEVVQVVYDSVVAFHAPPNQHSLGVELCDWVGDKNGNPLPITRWDDEPHDRMLHRAARLVAELCLAYDVPIQWVDAAGLKAGKHGITDHGEVSTAFGQSTHWDLGAWPRDRFIRLVRRHADRLRALAAAEPTAPEPDPITQPPGTPVPEPGPSTPTMPETPNLWVDGAHNLFRKLSAADMKHDLARSARADVRGICEGGSHRARRALLEHAAETGHQLLHPDGSELAALWNPEVFTAIPGRSGIVELHGRGPAGPNPARDLLWVGLRDCRTDKRLLRFVVHAAQGALKPDDQTPWGPRQEAWRDWAITQYWTGVAKHTLTEIRTGFWDAIVCGGDFNGRLANRGEWFYPGRLLSPIYHFDQARGIDRIIWSRHSHVQQTKRWSLKAGVRSDHPIQFARFSWEH